MLDLSWGEVLVIGAVALIVIGPKDLPKALRTLGSMTSKIRRMAGEFQSQFNEAVREAELDEIKKQVQGINDSVGSLDTGFNPIQTVRDELKNSIESTTSLTPPATSAPSDPAPAAPGQALGDAGSPLLVEPRPPAGEPDISVAAVVEQGVSAEPSPSIQTARKQAAESSKA